MTGIPGRFFPYAIEDAETRREIGKLASEAGAVRYGAIAELFHVSVSTVRRYRAEFEGSK
jgi:DeoR/GlpR family transcriptional regulator of sugar metabolism